jgi:hypothetical protein
MIRLKKSETKWKDFSEGVKIKIDYPTIQQQDLIDEVNSEAMAPALREAAKLRLDNPDMKDEEIQSLSASFIDQTKFKQVKRLTVKYALKDIDGSDEPLKLVETPNGTEIDDEQWTRICLDRGLVDELYESIREEISFTNADKKKLIGIASSQEKV